MQDGALKAGMHSAFIQLRINVDAMSQRCIDVNATLYKRHVPAGKKACKIRSQEYTYS